MENVRKPADLKIIIPGEPHLARSSPHDFYALVYVRWRKAESIPSILARPADMPEIPDADDFEVLRQDDGSYTLFPTTWRSRPFRFGKGSPTFYELERAGQMMGWGESLEYVSNLIKEYQPDYSYTVSEDNADFLLRTIKRLNQIENSVYALRDHLEYAVAGKKRVRAPRENPQRDVRAAILSDVMGLSTLAIKDELGLMRKWKRPQVHSTGATVKREDATTRAAIKRGRELLEHFYGAEEWSRKVIRMRAKRTEWLELEDQPKAQMYYLLAEARGTSMAKEERTASQDGFDQLLVEWIAAWERNDEQTANDIEARDLRFDVALRQF
jgi:hypothetical protein